MRQHRLLVSLLILSSLSIGIAYGEIPHLINLQGYLADDQGPVTGIYEATFRIYDDSTDGNILWQEVDSVDVSEGLYSLILGNVNPVNISFDGDLWIGVQFSGHPEMTPRYRQTAVPFTFVAEYSDSSGAISDDAVTGAKILDGSVEPADLSFEPLTRPLSPGVSTAEIEDNAVTTGKISNGTILPEDLSYTPVLRPLSPGISNEEIADYAVTSDKIDDHTIAFIDIGQNGAADGQVIKWDSDVGVWISANDEVSGGGSGGGWTDDGSFIRLDSSTDSVGIGTATPAEKLDVDGNVLISGMATIGTNHTNTGQLSTIAGGSNNTVGIGIYAAAIGGGINNTANANYSVVSGGANNSASANTSVVSGGNGNTASGHSAAVGGGIQNTASGTNAVVSGGVGNTASGHTSYIGGGQYNAANNIYSSVGGGFSNIVNGSSAFIGGGQSNIADGTYAAVGGGGNNIAEDSASTAGGGRYNRAIGKYSVVSGGGGNMEASGNSVSGNNSIIGGGISNTVNGNYSSILGGKNNTIYLGADYSYLFGINAGMTVDSTFMVDMPHIRFGNEITGYEFPNLDGVSGQVLSTDGSGQLNWVDMSGGGSGGGWVDDGTAVRLETSTDNVGIGLSNPTAKLDVYGDLVVRSKANIGHQNTNSGSETFVAGYQNAASGLNSSVTGGFQNAANATRSLVGGGSINTVDGSYSAILGGQYNYVASDYSTIGSGRYDTVLAVGAGVLSGFYNVAGDEVSDSAAFIGGGRENSVSAKYGSITGGFNNHAQGDYGVIGGGQANAAWRNSSVGGGLGNNAGLNENDVYGTIAGGRENTTSDNYASISGGFQNTADGIGSVIGGGWSNGTASYWDGVFSGHHNRAGNGAADSVSFVGGGAFNHADAAYAGISGGLNNFIGGNYGIIGGGKENEIWGSSDAICGGDSNSVVGDHSFIGGGYQNQIGFNANNAVIVGGEGNRINNNGQHSVILGGEGNIIDNGAEFSTILGGSNNHVSDSYSLAFGNDVVLDSAGTIAFFNGSTYTSKFAINRDERDTLFYPFQIGTHNMYNGSGAYLAHPGYWMSGSVGILTDAPRPIDRQYLLSTISDLSINSWENREIGEKHIGPTAEDFVAAFDVGSTRQSDGKREDRYLAATDMAGVALAGIQELVKKIDALEKRNLELEQRIAELEKGR